MFNLLKKWFVKPEEQYGVVFRVIHIVESEEEPIKQKRKYVKSGKYVGKFKSKKKNVKKGRR